MNKQLGRENDSVEVLPAVNKSEVALREEAILQFWQERDIFNKSIEAPAGSAPVGNFIFYDGPPFATGTPHYGHILAGTIKDAIPRFWTMNGFKVERKWGWDCHGLPLENLIEKKLGLATKRDIEAYGVKNFNETARSVVMEYADDWKKVVPRMGRWADMEADYKTMDSTYTESVWWAFAELHKKGLVFEGFKTMHLCPRCGTTLSNFEVNQGYKDIKDIAVTVKLPLLDEANQVTQTSLLVWTTTPWTLPGNLAAAINRELDYVEVKLTTELETDERLILAKGRLAQLGTEAYEITREFKGVELVGRRYEPPFLTWQNQDLAGRENAWTIYHADYVELGEEGTGAVHLAPAYGEDDMNLAKEHGVPIVHHVDTAGRFMEFVTDFSGQLVKPKDDANAEISHLDADIEVVKLLKDQGKLFKKENITHSYPHCWRCETPLLNYATTSWFVNVPKIKDKIIKENNQVNWVPDHVGTNRFGKWLEGARDWAVSRQRYWGAPLPIWKNATTGDYKIFGSLADLKAHVPKTGNQYFVVRHAEAESNLTGVINALPDEENTLTKLGEEQCQTLVESLREKNITKIIHSGLRRTKMTAELVAKGLGLPVDAVLEDKRVIEYQPGVAYEGKTWSEFNQNFSSEAEKFSKTTPGAENRRDLIKRVGDFLYEFEANHQNESVLIIGHGSSIFALECVAAGADLDQTIALKERGYFKNAEIKALPFTPLPHNDFYELDYHRPYIDEVKLIDTDGSALVRILDVFDCWFESGSMPYAQHHYPFENSANFFNELYPANFIAEGLDQTRGWFYSLIVLGTALFDQSPYQNVIVNGLALAEDGKKMSKSLRNYPDPMELADRVGADSMRYYLLTSPIIRGEDLNFSEKEVAELQRKNIGRLHNVLLMYQMYEDGTAASYQSDNLLDRWILARLNQLIADVTAGYRGYELDKATRPLALFIDDISVWYLRRSRERLKGDEVEDRKKALGTLRYILRELAKVMAPVMPFYAEHLYLAVKAEDEAESVHLCAWPVGGTVESTVIETMTSVRELVTSALEARTKANLKVRQPLAGLSLTPELLEKIKDYQTLIKEEVNVKVIVDDADQTESVVLDTKLTPELIAEGAVRELIRAVQDLRKEANLAPADRIKLTIMTDDAGQKAITDHQTLFQKTVGAEEINFAATVGRTITFDRHEFFVTVVK